MSLEKELVYFRALATLVRKAREIARSNPYDRRIEDLGLPALGKARDDRNAALATHFDGIEAALADAFLLRLVAAFEAASFVRLGTCVGEARKALDGGLPDGTPFARAAAKLVANRSDGMNLADLARLCRSYPTVDSDSVEALRLHRNYVAHGGRLGAQSTFADPVDVHRVLSETLAAIGGSDDE